MSKRLDETLVSVGFENLINGTYPPAEVFSVKVKQGQGVLKRGSLLAAGETEGELELISTSTTGKANAVLAEDVDTGSEEALVAVAYRTGHFNTNALIVKDEYSVTAADKEALRSVGILLSDAVEV